MKQQYISFMVLLNTLSSTIHCGANSVVTLVSFCTGQKPGASTQCESVKYAAAVAVLYNGKEKDKDAANDLMKTSKEALKKKKVSFDEFQQPSATLQKSPELIKFEEAHNALSKAYQALEENFTKHWNHFPLGAAYTLSRFDNLSDPHEVNNVYMQAKTENMQLITTEALTHLSGDGKDAKALQDLISDKRFSGIRKDYNGAVDAIGRIVSLQGEIHAEFEKNTATLEEKQEPAQKAATQKSVLNTIAGIVGIKSWLEFARDENVRRAHEDAQREIENALRLITVNKDDLESKHKTNVEQAEMAFKKSISALTEALPKNKKYAKLSTILDSMTIAEGYQVFEQVK